MPWIVGTILAVALLAAAVSYLAARRGSSPHHETQTSSRTALNKQPPGQDRFTQIQRQLTAAGEFDAELQETVYYQGPAAVRIAWQKPDFVFIHVGGFGDNPRTWYWYENQKLCIYEEWPARGGRGVCVTNVLDVAGGAERAFALVLNKCGGFAYFGELGLRAIHLLEVARSDRLEIVETDKEWRCTASEDSFAVDSIKPFLSGTEYRTLVTFLLPREAQSPAAVAKILVEYQNPNREKRLDVPPEGGVITDVKALRFSLDRKQLQFANPPAGSMKTVEIESSEKLGPEIINSLPLVAVPENQ